MRKLFLAVVMAFFVATIFSGLTATPASAEALGVKTHQLWMPGVEGWTLPISIEVKKVRSGGLLKDMLIVGVDGLSDLDLSSLYLRVETQAEVALVQAEDPYASGVQMDDIRVSRPLAYEGYNLQKSANGKWYSMVPKSLICDGGAAKVNGQVSIMVSFSFRDILLSDPVAAYDLVVDGSASYTKLGAGVFSDVGSNVFVSCL